MWFECPFLDDEVELTDERRRHTLAEHSELLPDGLDRIAATLREPDLIMRSRRSPSALLFSRWYDDFLDGKFLIVVIEQDRNG